MKKKILAIALVVAMLAIAVVGGTMAYLTDEDGAKNVMTYGNVYIEQHEYQRAEGVADNATASKADGTLVPFVQNVDVYPAATIGEYKGLCTYNQCYTAFANQADCFKWGDYVWTGTAWNGLWDSSKLTNVRDKIVMVENTGSRDAYFRTILAVECPEGYSVGEIPQGADIMLNIKAEYNSATDVCTADNEAMYVEINGVRYMAMVMYFQSYEDSIVKAGMTRHPSLLQFVMSDKLDNEDMDKWGGTVEILTLTQATQVEGFEDAQMACDMAFGDFNADNYVEWLTPIANAPAGPVELG